MKKILNHLRSDWYKYLLELIVITAGVLGAFALNSWNEQRKLSNKEILYLSSINEEFKKNKEQFDEITNWHKVSVESLKGILREYESENPNADSLIKYHMTAWYTFTFDPSQSILESLLSTSSLDIIQSDELRVLLVGWKDLVADYKAEELMAEADVYERIRPYFMRNFKHYQNLDKGELIYGETLPLTFENMIEYRLLDLSYILDNIFLENNFMPENEKVRQALNRIIELTETN